MGWAGSASLARSDAASGELSMRLPWPLFFEQELVEVSVARNRDGEFARVIGLPRFDPARDPPRLQELGDELRVCGIAGSFLGRGITALDQHALDQAVHLGQGFGRRIDEQRLETSPLSLPIAAIETGIGHKNRMRTYDPFETLRP